MRGLLTRLLVTVAVLVLALPSVSAQGISIGYTKYEDSLSLYFDTTVPDAFGYSNVPQSYLNYYDTVSIFGVVTLNEPDSVWMDEAKVEICYTFTGPWTTSWSTGYVSTAYELFNTYDAPGPRFGQDTLQGVNVRLFQKKVVGGTPEWVQIGTDYTVYSYQ